MPPTASTPAQDPGVAPGVTRARHQDDVVGERVRDRGLQDRITGRRGGSADPEGQVDDLRAVRDGVTDPGRGRPHRRRAGAAHDHRQDPGPRRDAHGAGAGTLPGDHHRHGRAVPVLAHLDVGVAVAAGPGQVGTGQDHAAQVRDGGLDPAFHLADDDTGSLGQRPHRPPHLPGGEPPLGRARRQFERRPHARLGPGRPGGQGQPARREQAGHGRRRQHPAARRHGTPTPPTSPAVCVYQAVHPGHGARHGPAHGSGRG
jgi:hypothetical protein